MEKIVFVFGSHGTLGSNLVLKLKDKNYYIVHVVRGVGGFSFGEKEGIIKVDLADLKYAKKFGEYLRALQNVIPISEINILYAAGVCENSKSVYFNSDIENIFNVNCLSYYYIVKGFIENIKEGLGGTVIAVCTNLLLRMNHFSADYISSKAALLMMSKQFAYEFGEKNIRFNTVSPGYFKSKMSDDIPSNIIEIIKRNTPLQKIGTVDDIANVIIWLLSTEAKWITGENIVIDGGNTIGF